MTHIVQVVSDARIEAVRDLFREYAAWLDIDLGFQGFESELATLPGSYRPPGGALLLALDDDVPLGCVAIRPFEPPGIAELKRLYVRPQARGLGLGSALMNAAIEAARGSGYDLIRLDTLPVMGSAQKLYRSLGFTDIAPYRFNPVAGATYLELDLRGPSRNGRAIGRVGDRGEDDGS